MRFILFVLFIQLSFLCNGQKIDWTRTKNWRIYALNKDAGFSYSLDTLSRFKNVRIDDSSMIAFFREAKQWPKRQYASWMGMYFASYEGIDGKVQKVVLSSYGGFFFDSFSRRYYELPKELRKRWNEFLNLNLKKIFDE